VVGNSNSGTALAGLNWGSGYGLLTLGKVQISGQGAAAGNVLTSDATGNATWQALPLTTKVSIKGYGASGSFPSSTYTTITNWATIESQEGGSNYNTGTGEYTIPVTGLYSIDISGIFGAPSSNGFAILGLSVNGNTSTNEYALTPIITSSTYTGISTSTTKMLTAGDKVTFVVYDGTGGNLTITNFGAGSDARTTRFSITLLH
jgi:hypothetical protein